MAEEALLTMRGICKYFPGVRALENVDFTLHSGEVHALVGENGAGKSTLIKVLTGVHAKDGGKIAMEGRPISPSSPLEAMKCGISTVYQEVNLCPNLSVAENIFIGREPKKAGGIDFSMPLALGYTGLSDAVLKKYIEDSAALWAGHTEGELPVHTIGATIGTHVGPGAVAVAFFHPAN